MKFDAEQKAHIDALIHGRLERERRRQAIQLQQLIAERDGLRVEIERLRAELNDLWPRPRPRLGARVRRWLSGSDR